MISEFQILPINYSDKPINNTDRDLSEEIEELQICLQNDGASYILQKYETLSSALQYISQMDKHQQKKLWSLIIQSCKQLFQELSSFFDGDSDHELQAVMRNTFKMTLYATCCCTERFEQIDLKRVSDEHIILGKKQKKTKPGSSKNVEFDWTKKKDDMIKLMLHLCNLPVQKLWSPYVAEEELIDILVNMSYRLLENPSITSTKSIKDNVIQLLGLMIKKHSLTLGCTLKLIQLLNLHEHLPQVLAEAVEVFVKKFDIRNIVSEIMREISSMDGNEFTKDNSSTKSFAVFLTEIAERLPELVLNNISMILSILDHEAYTLRNGVLGMIAAIVLKLFCKNLSDDKDKINRDKLLDYLEDHMHDVHAFVRSKVLQLWASLVEKNAIPIARKHQIFKLTIERISDKSSHVRKYAVQLIVVILQNNPMAAKFSLDEIQQNYEKEKLKLEEMLTLISTNLSNQLQKLSLTDTGEISAKKATDKENDTCLSDNEENSDVLQSVEDKPVMKQEKVVQYLKETVEFTRMIYEATPLICRLLDSQQNSDVLEAVEFFVESFSLGLIPALQGVRHMLLLIKSKETVIKEAVVEAYKKLYLPTTEVSKKNQAKTVVKNLVSLVAGSTIGELTSLEELISEFVISGNFSLTVIQVLWEFVSRKMEDVSLEESRIALLLLSMAANVEPEIIHCNIEILLNVGLNTEIFDSDLILAKNSCISLIKMFNRNSSREKSEVLRFQNDHILFSYLLRFLETSLKYPNTKFWIPFMEKAINLIYCGADQPDKMCEQILLQLIEYLNSVTDDKETCKTFLLTWLLSLVGHIALNQLIHLDVNIFSELKRRHCLQEEDSFQTKQKRNSIGPSASYTPKVAETETEDEQMGLLGAVADDSEADYIRDICETEIVTGNNFLAMFSPIIIEICSKPEIYSDNHLQNTAALALGKYMIVSSEFCEAHLQLLFTIMEKSEDPKIRKNLVIVLGDLAFRFPNLIDPWTSHLYDQLKDSCNDVRHNMLTILSNLILNDMIKVKGQISEVAKCIVDENEIISQFAKTFFTELGKKGNAVYNILPDVVSRLSDSELGIEENKFRIIMKFLFSFIQKDRQLETLVEKLCQRFKISRLERQWRDLAFCLSLLSYSGRSIQKLQENFGCYKDKLNEPFLYKTFLEILTNCKKSTKPEIKVVIEELEDLIEATQKRGLDDDLVLSNANKISRKTPAGKAMKSARKLPNSNKENCGSDEFVISARRSSRKKKIQPVLTFDSDESS